MKISKDTKLAYLYLTKWIILSIISGVIGPLVVHSFHFLLKSSVNFLSTLSLPLFSWSIVGALFAGFIVYRISPYSAGEGIPSYIRGIQIHNGELLFKVTFFKYFAALTTLATFGSGGVVGPLGRVSAGIMSSMCQKTHILFRKHDWSTAAICGMSAAVGAIFHSSIGAGIFAVEVMQRKRMGYKDIFPAILSSSLAVFLCKAIGWKSFYNFTVPNIFMDISYTGALFLLIFLVGVLGGLYVRFYEYVSNSFGRSKEKITILKLLLGVTVASIIAWLVNPNLLSTSSKIIPAIITNDISILTGHIGGFLPLFFILLIAAIVKGISNCLTVGCGMSAGFTGPAAIIGMLVGASVAHLFQIPPQSATYYAFVAAGFCGFLASSMNIPLAAAIMTIEVFGLQYSLAAGLAAVIGFQVTKNQDIYDFAIKNRSPEM